MNYLEIKVETNHNDQQSWGSPIIVSMYQVRFYFKVKNPEGETVMRVTIYMEARMRCGGEDHIRDELKQSARADYEVWHTYGHYDKTDELHIDIIDPHGVLKWFGMDAAADLFKQNQKNAEPLRLPAARFD